MWHHWDSLDQYFWLSRVWEPGTTDHGPMAGDQGTQYLLDNQSRPFVTRMSITLYSHTGQNRQLLLFFSGFRKFISGLKQ